MAGTDEENRSASQSEFDVVLAELEGSCFDTLLDVAVHFANGYLDFDLIVVANFVGDAANSSETELSGRAYQGVLVIMLALFWYWFLSNFWLPFMKLFLPKRYWLWLGNKGWKCCCDECCSRGADSYGIFHPKNAIVVNMFISDVCFTIYAYFEKADKNPTDPTFLAKAVVAVAGFLFDLRVLFKDLKLAQRLYRLKP